MNTSLKASVTAVIIALGLGAGCSGQVNGDAVQSEDIRQRRIASSPQFVDGKVISRLPQVEAKEGMLRTMWQFFTQRDQFKPGKPLEFESVDTDLLAERSRSLRVTWLGHSSLFVELDRSRILIDPVFEYASPSLFSSWFGRNVPAPVSREELPRPDVILISHDHYDHLEESTVRFYANQDVTFYVPLGVGRYLEKWAVKPANIHEFDWWESEQLNGVTFTAAPANHNSGRGLFDHNTTLWSSWAIQGNAGSVFYSGDSAYGEHFKEIGERLGPFDLSFIEVAANVKHGKGYPVAGWGHMQASYTLQAHQDVRADKLMPVHWSTYELFLHRWDEPVTDLIAEAEISDAALVTPMIGQSLDFAQPVQTTYWWQKDSQWLDFSQLAQVGY